MKAAGSLRQKRLASQSTDVGEAEPVVPWAASQPAQDPAYQQSVNLNSPLIQRRRQPCLFPWAEEEPYISWLTAIVANKAGAGKSWDANLVWSCTEPSQIPIFKDPELQLACVLECACQCLPLCSCTGIALFALLHQSLILLGHIGQSANRASDAPVTNVVGRGHGQVTGLFPSSWWYLLSRHLISAWKGGL